MADMTRRAEIIAAMETYPIDGWYTKRRGYPHLRDLRKHAGVHVTRRERRRLWPPIATRRDEIITAMQTFVADDVGRFTKRNGYPFLSDLSKHAGIDITRQERRHLWPDATL